MNVQSDGSAPLDCSSMSALPDCAKAAAMIVGMTAGQLWLNSWRVHFSHQYAPGASHGAFLQKCQLVYIIIC